MVFRRYYGIVNHELQDVMQRVGGNGNQGDQRIVPLIRESLRWTSWPNADQESDSEGGR